MQRRPHAVFGKLWRSAIGTVPVRTVSKRLARNMIMRNSVIRKYLVNDRIYLPSLLQKLFSFLRVRIGSKVFLDDILEIRDEIIATVQVGNQVVDNGILCHLLSILARNILAADNAGPSRSHQKVKSEPQQNQVLTYKRDSPCTSVQAAGHDTLY